MVSKHSKKKLKTSNTTLPLQQSSNGAAAVAFAPVILSSSSTSSTEAPLLNPKPLRAVLRTILKEVPQLWMPVSLKEDPVLLRSRLEAIFRIIQKYDKSGGKKSTVLDYFKDLLDEDSESAYSMRLKRLYQFSNDAELDSDKVIVELLKLFHHKNYAAYQQIMNPAVGETEDIKTALERLHGLTLAYDISDPVTAVARLLSLLLSKPEFSGLSNFRGSDDYAGLLKGAINLCNYYLNKGETLPSFNGVSNNNSTEAGQGFLDCSFRKRKRKCHETSKCSKRISSLYKDEDVDNIISESKIKALIKDGLTMDEAIAFIKISSKSDSFLDSTFPHERRNDPKSKSKRDEEQQLTLLCNLLPPNWDLIDNRLHDEVLEHQLEIVFQTLATILPPNAPITEYIEMLRKVSSDEFSMLLHKCLPKELPSLKGPESPPISSVIKAIMNLLDADKYLLSMELEYPRPWEGESTVEFLERLEDVAKDRDWKVPSTAFRNLICFLGNSGPQFSSLLGFENLYPDYKLLLAKAIAIAQLFEDGGYPISLGTDHRWSGRDMKNEK